MSSSKTSKSKRLSNAQLRILIILNRDTDMARIYEDRYTYAEHWIIRDGRGLVDRVANSTVSVLARAGYITLTGNGYKITSAGSRALEESK